MSNQTVVCMEKPIMPEANSGIAFVQNLNFNQILTPWCCHHHDGVSEIEAYVAHNGKRHVIAETFGAPGVNAEATAELIITAINEREKMKELMGEMLIALETCLDNGGLSWEAEQEVDAVIMRTKQSGFL